MVFALTFSYVESHEYGLQLILNFNGFCICWQNLKMKISHPRFLNIGTPEVLDVKFPACLEKGKSSAHKDADLDTTKQSETVFHFPEVSEGGLFHGL